MSLSFKKLKRFKPGEALTAEALNALTDAVERNTIEESPTVRPSRSASGSLQLHAKEWPENLFNPFYVSVLYNKKTKEEDGGYMLTLNRGAIYAPAVFQHQPSSQNTDVPYTQFYRFEVGHLAQDPDDRDQKVAKPQSDGRDNLGDLSVEEPSEYNQFDSPIAQVNETWYCRLIVKFWEKPEEGIKDLNQRKAFVDGGYADCQKFVEYVGCEWLREDDYLLEANDTEFEKYLTVAYVEVLDNGNYKTHNVVRSDLALFDPCPVDVSSSSSSSSSSEESSPSSEEPPPSDSGSVDDSSTCPPVFCVTDIADPDWSAEVYQQSDILYSGISDPDEVTVELRFIDVGAVEEAATGRVDRWALFVDGVEVGESPAEVGDCAEPGSYGDYEVAEGPCPDSSYSSSDSDECPETYCVVGPEWEVTVVRGQDSGGPNNPFDPNTPVVRNWYGSRQNDPGGDPFDVTEVSLTVNLDTSVSELKVDSVSQGTETSPDDCPVEGGYGVYEVIAGSCGSASVYSSDSSGSAYDSSSSDSSGSSYDSSSSVYSSDSSGSSYDSSSYDSSGSSSSDSSSYDSSDPSKPAIVPFRKEWIRWACMEMPQAMFMDTRDVPVKRGKGELTIEPEVLESVEPGSLFVLSTTPKEDVLALTNGVVVHDTLKVRYASGLLRKKPKTITVFYAGLRKGAGERFKRYQEDEAKRSIRFQNQWRKSQNDKT